MITMAPRCDIGGDYTYDHNNKPVYHEPCIIPPTFRFRSAGMVDNHWSHRCYRHVVWLDLSVCTVEPLEVAQ